MSIRRVVPNIASDKLEESRDFYAGLLGLQVAMDMGWIVTFVSLSNPTAQVSVLREDASAPVVAQVTVEVADVDAVHAEAVRRGLELVYPLTDEPLGRAALLRQGPERGGGERGQPPWRCRDALMAEQCLSSGADQPQGGETTS
jgi:catechol 2,3-dioxygenase-like lactoylglutathione lyase family enzyme